MQKANYFYRLLGLLAAALLAVCFLPLTALAAGPVTFNIEYLDEDQYVVGTQKGISAPIDAEGKVDLAAVSLNLPEGYTLADALGKLAVKNGDTVVIPVKAPPAPKTVTVNYWDVENKTAAGTGRITVDKAATQADTALLTDVPAGFALVTRGNAPIVDGMLYVEVKPLPVDDGRVVMNVQFKDGDTTVRGGDFRVPAGVQKYAVLNEYVPAGYILTQTGDFTAAAGAKLTAAVRKYPGNVTVNVRFMDGDKTVADGDYFVAEGVRSYADLARYLPKGYAMDVAGNFMARSGAALEVPVHKLAADPAARTGDQPAKPAKPGDKPAATAKPAANPADSGKDTKAAPAARNEVVKANAPAANTSKIIPQTGLSLKSPVLLGVMLAAALVAAAAYLFVIRKKLN